MQPDHPTIKIVGAKCGADTRAGGKCRKPAGWGSGHPGVGACRLHGGCTPSHEFAGSVALARRDAEALGRPLDVDPYEAILECIRIAAGEVRYASERIAELRGEDLVGPVVTTKVRPLKRESGAESTKHQATETITGPPAAHVWVRVRDEALDRLVRFSKIAIDAGIEERRVRLAEQAGDMMAELIRGVLADLGVPLHDPRTRQVVTRHLRLLEGGPTDGRLA